MWRRLPETFEYDVRYVNPAEVRADLVRVWRDNLPVDQVADAKFDWIYRKAVEPPAGVFVLAARSSTAQTIVGTAGLVVRKFFVDDTSLRAGLLADLAVDREHRTAMPALRLVRSARNAAVSEFDLAYGFPNKSARAVFLRCGYHKLGTLTRWARVLRHARYVQRVIPVRSIARLAGAALDAGGFAQLGSRALTALRTHRISWPTEVDDRFDRLWQAARRSYTLIGTRDAAFLRWRFLDQPGHTFRLAALSRRGEPGDLRAYAVVGREGDHAFIRDLFGHPGDLDPLLDLLLVDLARQGAVSASMGFLGSEAITRLLQSRGFKARESERTIVCDVGKARADMAEIIRDVQSWHLTDADEDT